LTDCLFGIRSSGRQTNWATNQPGDSHLGDKSGRLDDTSWVIWATRYKLLNATFAESNAVNVRQTTAVDTANRYSSIFCEQTTQWYRIRLREVAIVADNWNCDVRRTPRSPYITASDNCIIDKKKSQWHSSPLRTRFDFAASMRHFFEDTYSTTMRRSLPQCGNMLWQRQIKRSPVFGLFDLAYPLLRV